MKIINLTKNAVLADEVTEEGLVVFAEDNYDQKFQSNKKRIKPSG